MFSIAACNYVFREVADFDGFAAHVREVLDAADDADLIVLPELLSLELQTALPGWRTADLGGLAETARFADEFQALFAAEAAVRDRHILAGSFLRRSGDVLRNVAQVYGPSGLVAEHEKTHLFPAEFALGTSEGDGLEAFDLPFVRAGITVCYEPEIPECSASLVGQGALALLTPSLTFTEAGFWRVRHCVQARCVENQVFAVHASAGGPARGAFPGAYAASAVCTPCDAPWTADGVAARVAPNVDGVAVATLDLEALAENRRSGAATTFADRRRRADRYAAWPGFPTS